MNTPKQVYMAINRSYWYGFFSYMGVNMFIQDWLGLEGYIAFVERNWADLHWGVGLVIAALAMTLKFAIASRFSWLNEEKWLTSLRIVLGKKEGEE
jgi:hypothetical protein